MKSPVARRARNSNAQCCHHTATGRRCRSTRSSSDSCLCPRHRAIEQKLLSAEPDDLTPEFTDLEDSLQTVDGIHTSLSELYILVVQDRISPRRASVLAYVSSLLLRSLANAEKNAAKSKPRTQIIYNWAPREDTLTPRPQPLRSQTQQSRIQPTRNTAASTAARENAPKPADIANGTANPSAATTGNGSSAATARNLPSAVNLANNPNAPSCQQWFTRSERRSHSGSAESRIFLISRKGIFLGDYANARGDPELFGAPPRPVGCKTGPNLTAWFTR